MSDDYEVLELIGRGSFGQIRKVRRKSDGLILVRKEISYVRMSPKEREQLHTEFGILSSLKHPNIVQYYHRDHIKSDMTLHLYMEYCGNGDLSQVIRKCQAEGTLVPEPLVWSVFAQIIMALYRCHFGVDPPAVGDEGKAPAVPKGAFTVLHRDLKPENIFLDKDNSVKLGDFGLSKILTGEHHLATTYVGTPFYMSPELICDLPYTSKSDIWSLGCVMYELCKLSPPFNAKTHFSLCQKIKEGKFAPIPSQYSSELQRVISQCLRIDAKSRPDTAQLLNLEPVRMVRRETEAVQIKNQLKMQQEKLKLREQALQMKEQELINEYNRRGKELDSQLREQWAKAAEVEIQRRVQMEIEARLPGLVEEEVNRRLAEHMAEFAQQRPHTPTSIFASSQGADSAPQQPLSVPEMPPSPMDVHMQSPAPAAFDSPRRHSSDDPFNMGASPLKRPIFPPPQLNPNGERQARTLMRAQTQPVHHGEISPLRHHPGSVPNLSQMMNGVHDFGFESPTKQLFRKRNILQPSHSNANLPTSGNNLFGVKGKSLVEISREQNSRNGAGMVGGEVFWDPEKEEMPSPFIRRGGKRI